MFRVGDLYDVTYCYLDSLDRPSAISEVPSTIWGQYQKTVIAADLKGPTNCVVGSVPKRAHEFTHRIEHTVHSSGTPAESNTPSTPARPQSRQRPSLRLCS